MKRQWNTAFVGIGSNLEHPKQQVQDAIDAIDQQAWCLVTARSSLYMTEPIGFLDQPEFVNAACKLKTSLDPVELLNALLQLESTLGRIRTEQVNGPRHIDLDLLLYEERIMNSAQLVLPHPRMHERRFVLQPLIEIEPTITIPNFGSAEKLNQLCKHQNVVKLQ